MRLSPQQRERLWSVLLDAFSYPELKRLLDHRLDRDLDHIVPRAADFQEVCFELVKSADKGGWAADLVRAAAAENLGYRSLRQLEEELDPAPDGPDAADTGGARPVPKKSRPRHNLAAAPSPVKPVKPVRKAAARAAFVSYAHQDAQFLQEFLMSVSQLRRDGLIDDWHDNEILPGRKWRNEIDQHLERADLVVLLVSKYYLASLYAYDYEMHRALERSEAGLAVVVPVILRRCDWQYSPLAALEVLPGKGLPVSAWPDQDEAWLNVVQGLRRLVAGQE